MKPVRQLSKPICSRVDTEQNHYADFGPPTQLEFVCFQRVQAQMSEDISHVLLHCSSLPKTRSTLITFFFNSCSKYPLLSDIITNFILSTDNHLKTQFLLDCSTLPDVIRQRQLFGFPVLQQLFSLTRTWCFSLHRDRLRMLGRWRY